ncbi:MAG: hypothetical protein JW895_01510 [Thermoleophilaceae bacterium]|nr:hypothetical protein [Thermoleophilaceae bacterium]
MERGYARSRRKNEEARAALAPLAPGERPTAVTVAFVVAVLLAIANVVALVADYDSGDGQKTGTTIVGTVILVLVAAGMWRARYWAVLGMQTLLALALVIASLWLLTANNLAAVLLSLTVLAVAGTLFWFLVKAMARIQMPQRPGA